MMNKKINIVVILCSIFITCKAMDHIIEPEQESVASKTKESSVSIKNQEIFKHIKSEISSKENKETKTDSKNIKDKISLKNVKHNVSDTITPDGLDLNLPSKSNTTTSYDAGLNQEITLTDEKNTSQTTTNTTLDSIIEEQSDAALEDLINNVLDLSEYSPKSLQDIVTEGLKNVLFHILKLPKNLQTTPATESFKYELQYLSEQIQKYDATNIYTNIDQMLAFIKSMNEFLKESQLVQLSSENLKKIDSGYTTASDTSNIFKTKNMIFDVNSVSKEVIKSFEQSINDGQKISKITNSKEIIHAIYGEHGSINIITNNWNQFKRSNDIQVDNNLYYAAFMTFILIFQDSILATICILNETSQEFDVTNELSAQALHYTVQKGSDTIVNNSFNIAVSSD